MAKMAVMMPEVMRMPLEGGGRLVVEMTPDEIAALGEAIKTVTG